MISAELQIWIVQGLPIDGEWYTTGYEVFLSKANKMKSLGVSEEDIKEILEELYHAVTQEYGN